VPVRRRLQPLAGRAEYARAAAMKKLLLTGIAALFLATGTAHAVHDTTHLPEHWQGRWCYDSYISTKSQEVFFRPTHKNINGEGVCGDFDDGIYIDEAGYINEGSMTGEQPACDFEKKVRGEGDTYVMHVVCSSGKQEGFDGEEEFQLINGLLFKKRMPQG